MASVAIVTGTPRAQVGAEVDRARPAARAASTTMMFAMLPTISRLPASVLASARIGAGLRVRRARQQQHHRRHVRHQVRQHDAERRTARAGRPGSTPRGAQVREQRVHRARPLERVVDDEQADEQHQQLPVDQRHASRATPSAATAAARRRRTSATHSRGSARKNRNATISTAVTRQALACSASDRRAAPCSCGIGQSRAPAAAVLERDHRPGRRQAEQHRHARVAQVAGERQLQRLADQHVLRVADQRRRRADVRRAGEREQERHRIEPRRAQPSTSTGAIARQTMSLVSTALSRPARPTTSASRRGGETSAADQPARHVRVEASQPELRRHHHHREQQVSVGTSTPDHALPSDSRPTATIADRAQQRDAGAVQRQPGDLAEDHADVDEPEDDEGRGVHRRPSNLTGAAFDCTVSSGGQLR